VHAQCAASLYFVFVVLTLTVILRCITLSQGHSSNLTPVSNHFVLHCRDKDVFKTKNGKILLEST